MSHPRSSPSLSPTHNGCRAQLGERGALYVGLPGTDRSLPGMKNRKKMEIPALYLYQRMFCCMIPTAVPGRHLVLCTYWASGGRGETWRGKNRHTGPALALSAIPFPVSRVFSAVLLLYYYRTHILGSWVVGCSFSAA